MKKVTKEMILEHYATPQRYDMFPVSGGFLNPEFAAIFNELLDSGEIRRTLVGENKNIDGYVVAGKEVVFWTAPVGGFDDFDFPIRDVIIDGKTTQGPWAIMTPESFKIYGRGLGLGRGQKYQKQADGRWLKIEG